MSISSPSFDAKNPGIVDSPKLSKNIFGGMNVHMPVNIMDIKHIDSLNPELVHELTANGGSTALDADIAAAVMSVTATAGSKTVRQTRHLPYQSGKAFSLTLTGVPFVGSVVPGVKWQAGFFDDSADKDMGTYPSQYPYGNGLFFQYHGGWSFVNRCSSTGAQVDETFDQSNWNADKLDGTGKSKMNLDPTKLNIFWLEFGWLSTLGFRFGVFHEGRKILAHEQWETNVNAVPFMQKATLPICYRLENVSGGAASSRMVCATAESLGGYEPTGVQYTIDGGAANQSVPGNSSECLLAIRLKQKHNKRSIEILKNAFMCTSSGNARVRVVVNPTFTSESWADVGDGSGVEYAVNPTMTANTGRPQNTDWVSNNSDEVTMRPDSLYYPSSDIEGKSDVFALVVSVVGGASENYLASVSWKEFI